MIEIIFVLIFFSFAGYILTTFFGYVYIGLACAFIIVLAITIAAIIFTATCSISSAIVEAASDVSSKAERERAEAKKVYKAPTATLDQRIAAMERRGGNAGPQTVVQIAVTPTGVDVKS